MIFFFCTTGINKIKKTTLLCYTNFNFLVATDEATGCLKIRNIFISFTIIYTIVRYINPMYKILMYKRDLKLQNGKYRKENSVK